MSTLHLFLISKNADVNLRGCIKTTALIQASMHGHADIVKLLLIYGANINNKDIYGNTALTVASKNKHIDICKILLSDGAKIIGVEKGKKKLFLLKSSIKNNIWTGNRGAWFISLKNNDLAITKVLQNNDLLREIIKYM